MVCVADDQLGSLLVRSEFERIYTPDDITTLGFHQLLCSVAFARMGCLRGRVIPRFSVDSTVFIV